MGGQGWVYVVPFTAHSLVMGLLPRPICWELGPKYHSTERQRVFKKAEPRGK